MAEPRIELFPEPMQNETVTFQLLAPPKNGGEARAQVSVLLGIKNLEPTDIVLTNVGIKIHFSDNSTPLETSNPVSTRIPAGEMVFWHNRVYDTKAADTGLPADVSINQNVITQSNGNIIQFKLTFRNYSDKVKKMYALRPHSAPVPERAYAFPAKWTDLRWNEVWNGSAAVHGESEYGSQLFALDVGNVGWDADSETWSSVLPGKDGSKNEHYRIWGKPLYAMADGEIIKLRWNFPDNEKMGLPVTPDIQKKIDEAGDGGGNFILILTGDEVHGYSHIMNNSIPEALRVKNARVSKGDYLGKVGNSGNSSNPHTHIGVSKHLRVVVKGRPKRILRPMPFTNVRTINSSHARGLREEDPWFLNAQHGLSVVAGAWPETCLIWPSKRQPGSSRLVLKEFRCVEETDAELGGEAPYFIIFAGKRSGDGVDSRVVRIRREAWDNTIDEGELWVVNEDVITQIDKNTLIMVGMIDEDFDVDISNNDMIYIRNEMRKAFREAASGNDRSLEQLYDLLRPKFVGVINLAKSNDEWIGMKRLEVTTLDGELPLLHFSGDGSNYRVRFKVVP